MKLDNKIETEKTVNYLRTLADMLENNQVHLNDITIEARNICWNVEEETLTLQTVKAVNNG
jgi:hypothetical protein